MCPGAGNPVVKCEMSTGRSTIQAVEDMVDQSQSSAGEKKRNMDREGKVIDQLAIYDGVLVERPLYFVLIYLFAFKM